jgi:pyruvate/2-oxoglutarate dehydrogenase complex dihydrolipoamide acyltransferase (E2) component
MSIFGNIMSAIFGRSSSAAAAPGAAAPAASPAQPAPAPAQAAAPTPASAPGAPVDVTAIMDGLAAQSSERLDWRRSIVDLMKLINLNSSLAARKELAQELNYAGDMNDSASMNIWLHKQVMIKLADNGGKVPDELRN